MVVKVEPCSNNSVAALSIPVNQTECQPDMEDEIVKQKTGHTVDKEYSGNQLFVAIVKSWLGSHLSEWQVDVNALNLRRASIN